MSDVDYELKDWPAIEDLAARGSSTSAVETQAKSARKLVFALANLRLAVNSHQKITGQRLEKLVASIDKFNESSGKLAKAANWLAFALVLLGIAQVAVALLNRK